MEVSVIEYYKTLPANKKQKVRALLEARVLSTHGDDDSAVRIIREHRVTKQDLLDLNTHMWDYVFSILPAESILKNLQ